MGNGSPRLHRETYCRNGPDCKKSIHDVTFTSDSLILLLDGWRLPEDFSASDREYIVDATKPALFQCVKRHEGENQEGLGTDDVALEGGGAPVDTVVNSVISFLSGSRIENSISP